MQNMGSDVEDDDTLLTFGCASDWPTLLEQDLIPKEAAEICFRFTKVFL